jgi:CheY-specific phosphatase CheX
MPRRFEFTAEPCQKEIIRIVQQLFETMLQTQAETTVGKPVLGPDHLTTQVRFGGAWQGTLFVQCTTDGAKQLARLFAGNEYSGDFEADECRDVMGELANIVAGNLKVLLPKGTQVSYPEAIEGAAADPSDGDTPVHIQTFLPPHRDPLALMLAVRS